MPPPQNFVAARSRTIVGFTLEAQLVSSKHLIQVSSKQLCFTENMERYWSLKNSYYRGAKAVFPLIHGEHILGEDYHQKLYIFEDIFNQTELLNLHFRYTSWEIETIFDSVFIKISKREIAAFWVQTQNVTPVTSIGTPNIIQVFTVLNVWRHFVKTTFYI